uniref:CSON011282 protein n=1 Tax=Culicoides sonorensis TaxID=179676 RepID=A0A336LQL8_CULSO
MELSELCRFCATNSTYLQISLFSKTDPNLNAIVDKFFPIKISEADNLPKYICKACFAQVMVVNQFFENIINADKVLRYKQEEYKKQQAAKIKIISEKLNRLPISIKKVPIKQIDSTVQQQSTNIKELSTPLSDISTVLHKLKGVTVKKTKITPAADQPIEKSDFDVDETTSSRRTRNKKLYFEEDQKTIENDNSDEDYKPPTPRTTPKKKKLSPNNGKSPSSKPIIKMMLNPGPAYVCVTCKSRFESFEKLKQHMVESQRCKDANVTCQICSKVCGNRKALYAHSLTHKEKTTFTCEICKTKSFTNRFNLDNHKASVHAIQVKENGSVFRCRLCEKQFSSRAELFPHMTEHQKEKIERLCEICGKSFFSMEALKSHCRTHSEIVCNVDGCNKKFNTGLELCQHSQAQKDNKMFCCKECGKNFTKNSSLKLHERTHKNESTNKCKLCGISYDNLIKLEKHMKNKHSLSTKSEPGEIIDEGNMGTEQSRTIEETVIIQPTNGQPSSYTLSFQNF